MENYTANLFSWSLIFATLLQQIINWSNWFFAKVGKDFRIDASVNYIIMGIFVSIFRSRASVSDAKESIKITFLFLVFVFFSWCHTKLPQCIKEATTLLYPLSHSAQKAYPQTHIAQNTPTQHSQIHTLTHIPTKPWRTIRERSEALALRDFDIL